MGRSIAIAVIAGVLYGAPLGAFAAGLGKLTVLSPLGQPLNAEVEIVSTQAGEEEGLTARLGSPEAFRQAGIEFNSVLAGMRFEIERRGGRSLLRLTTIQPVNEPFLDLLVELQWSTGRLVREYTFLLDPPEYKGASAIAAVPPAPAPAQKPLPEPAQPSAVQAKPLPEAPTAAPAATYEVKKGDTLGGIAQKHLAPGVTLNQMLIAIYRANQDAFIRDNINLVRAGRILNIPAGEAAGTVDPADATRLVNSQMADFAQYRRQLAAAPATAEAAPGQRAVTGRIEPKPAGEQPGNAQDELRLSKADPKKPGTPGSRAAREDDLASRERALKESQSRVAELEKNVADLQKLLELKNQQLAELEKKAGAKPAPVAPVAKAPEKPAAEAQPSPAPAAPQKPAAEQAPKPAAEAVKPAPEAAKPAAEAPKPSAEAQKPAAPVAKPQPKPAPPPPEPSLIDEFLDNSLALGGLAGVIVLLIGYGAWAWRRKKASQAAAFRDMEGADRGAAPFLGAPAKTAAATAAPSASQGLSAAAQPARGEAEEVDPIAEADVYMAYGRDAQAEEILKEALQKNPDQVPMHAKLLEIYAGRRDAKAFEQTALKVKSLTAGTGPDWDKAAALGHSIDPQNGLYAGAGGQAASAPAAVAAPVLDLDLGGTPARGKAPDISLEEASKETSASSIDFDLGGATAPPPARGKSDFTPQGTFIGSVKDSEPSGLNFDLGGGEKRQAPSAAAPMVPAEASGGLDFDFSLDLGAPAEKKAEPGKPPASAAPTDLSSISLDLGTAAEPSASKGGDPKWQEVATKLDLAKAYDEMGDKDGARELLNEVMKDGDAGQKGEARQLLEKLS